MGNCIHSRPEGITLFLPSLDGGGAERVFVQLANAFGRFGLNVHLALAAVRGPYLQEVDACVHIVDLGGGGVLRVLPSLSRHIKSARPVAILSALDHANIVAIVANTMTRRNTRCVISTRSVPMAVYREASFPRRHVLPFLMRATYRYADRVIANSRAVAMDLIEHFGVPQERVSVIYNPLDVDSIQRLGCERVENRWLSENETPLILGVGSLTALKDFPTLIRAFAKVRTTDACRLAILGEGPDRRKLENLVAELALERHVHLPGFVRNPFAWMHRAAVLVSSSLTEGCPNVVMQALACGTPVVCTDCNGGSAEILEGGKWGALVPIRDPTTMAAAIVKSMHHEAGVDGRRRAADFSIDEVARAFVRELLPVDPTAVAEG
ncbi:MAG TPA: glycosyltransferase [Steroidobacteraceae bacterium]|nr:glycosyltransferase [Steroidobacteraceae bacterium]